MKNYFKRLKEHPGLSIAIPMTVLGALGGAANQSFPDWWQGALFGIGVMFVACWIPVLLSNLRK